MLKGAQRKTVVVRGGTGSIYEAAYFILKKDSPDDCREADMLAEATRLIEENTSTCGRKAEGFRLVKQLAMFAAGLMTGAGTAGIVYLIIK